MNYLDDQILHQLSQIPISALNKSKGQFHGFHKSQSKGQNMEYREHREYVPGDSLRWIDWKVYGRTQKYFVREYEEDVNYNILFLLDESASMQIMDENQSSKLDYSRSLGLTAAYMMMNQGDNVGVAGFGDHFQLYTPPSKNTQLVFELDRKMRSNTGQVKTQLDNLKQGLNLFSSKEAIVFILSDLITNKDHLFEVLKSFINKQYEVILFHIISPVEKEFHFKGNILFYDPETGEEIHLDSTAVRDNYLILFKEWIEEIKGFCRKRMVQYYEMNTALHYSDNLVQFLRHHEVLTQ